MKQILRYILSFITILSFCSILSAQERKVQNRPYTDLRKLHYGVVIGTHWQDMELMNIGPQTVVQPNGSTVEQVILADQDRYDLGFNVGVLAELRLSQHFQLRLSPTMYFGTKHITFVNKSELDTQGAYVTQRQQLKMSYFSTPLELIFSAPRFNNHRPYLMTGLNTMINLTTKNDDYLKMKKYDLYWEIGLGCDFYLPFFKLRPELKFMFSLINSLDTSHPAELRDEAMRPYARSVSEASSKMIVLSFYFE